MSAGEEGEVGESLGAEEDCGEEAGDEDVGGGV